MQQSQHEPVGSEGMEGSLRVHDLWSTPTPGVGVARGDAAWTSADDASNSGSGGGSEDGSTDESTDDDEAMAIALEVIRRRGAERLLLEQRQQRRRHRPTGEESTSEGCAGGGSDDGGDVVEGVDDALGTLSPGSSPAVAGALASRLEALLAVNVRRDRRDVLAMELELAELMAYKAELLGGLGELGADMQGVRGRGELALEAAEAAAAGATAAAATATEYIYDVEDDMDRFEL